MAVWRFSARLMWRVQQINNPLHLKSEQDLRSGYLCSAQKNFEVNQKKSGHSITFRLGTVFVVPPGNYRKGERSGRGDVHSQKRFCLSIANVYEPWLRYSKEQCIRRLKIGFCYLSQLEFASLTMQAIGGLAGRVASGLAMGNTTFGWSAHHLCCVFSNLATVLLCP